MNKVLIIANNMFQELIHRKLLYLGLLGFVLLGSGVLRSQSTVRMAIQAGEPEIAATSKVAAMRDAVATWKIVIWTVGLGFGATALWSELRRKTVVTVLTRPLERWQFLLGKWLGLQAYLLVLVAVGGMGARLLAWQLEMPVSEMFWLGLLNWCTGALLASGLSLSLAIHLPPVVAGGITYFAFYPFEAVARSAEPWSHGFGLLGYYLAPVRLDPLVAFSFDVEFLEPEYLLYLGQMLENVLYAVTAFVISSALFSRRNISLGS